MDVDNFSLRWNDFEANITDGMKDLRQQNQLFDVTLVSEDGSQIQAHKLVLSICSPFFRQVLGSNPHQHPLLYLRGVDKEHLVNILNFMYLGEVNVVQDNLNSFLAVAEDLKVKGLTNSDSVIDQNKKPPLKETQMPSLPQPKNNKSHCVGKQSLNPIFSHSVPDSVRDQVHIKSEPLIVPDDISKSISGGVVSQFSSSDSQYTNYDEDDYPEEDEEEVTYNEGTSYNFVSPGLQMNNPNNGMSDTPGSSYFQGHSVARQRRQQILQFINLNKGRFGDGYQCLICLKQVTDNSNMNKHLEFKHGPQLKEYLTSMA